MRRWQRGLLGGAAAIGLSLAMTPAEAQGRGGITVRSQRGPTWRGERETRGETPRFSPSSSGALESNFSIMRDTSPNPRAYMGGQLNPRRSNVRLGYARDGFSFGIGYSTGRYGYGYDYGYYGPGYYGPVYSYPYLPVSPTLYPWGYAVPTVPPVTRERVVIIQGAIPPESVEPSRIESVRPERTRGDGEYYLSPKSERADEGLVEALMEIRKAWLNGDHARLKARIRDGAKVRIYPKGTYEYSVTAADFAQMTRDAMGRLDTLSFELEAPRTLAEGRAFAAGTHVYKDAGGEKQEVHVSYVLAKEEGRWHIVEVGSGSAPIRRHAE